MREVDLDKFLGKYVEVKDCYKKVSKGILYKIVGSYIENCNTITTLDKFVPFETGYFIEFIDKCGYSGRSFRRKAIKKIKEIEK